MIFRVEAGRAVLARAPDLLSLAGTVRVPGAKRNAIWDDVIRGFGHAGFGHAQRRGSGFQRQP